MIERFESICLIGITTLSKDELKRIQSFSKKKIQFFPELPKTASKISKLIDRSDCLLASRHLKLSAKVFEACPALKYVGIYGTSLENIDLDSANSKNIRIMNVPQYYDYDIVEFIIAELLYAVRGLGQKSWWCAPSSLEGKKLGLVGLGKVGEGLAKLAHVLKMEACYFDCIRSPEVEGSGVPYRGLNALLKEADIVSINVRVSTPMFLKPQFDLMKDGAILISISDGEVLKLSDFSRWIKNPRNLAIFDGIGGLEYRKFKKYKNVLISKRDAYVTKESFQRLTVGFLNNLAESCKAKI